MKTKLLAATVLFFALGISTTEAQNRRSNEQHKLGQQQRKNDGYSKADRWDKGKKDGKFKKNNGKYRSDKMRKNRHRNEFRKNKKQNRRHDYRSRYHRSHRF